MDLQNKALEPHSRNVSAEVLGKIWFEGEEWQREIVPTGKRKGGG
jgi:hypothetical protein